MTDCLFCNYEPKGRVLTESKNFYAVPAFGQITDGGHLIVVPKKHYACFGRAEEQELDELDRFLHKLKGKMRTIYGPVVGFEQGIYGQTINHAHMQILPVPSKIDLLPTLQRNFKKQQLHSITELPAIHGEYGPYMTFRSQNMLLHAFLPEEPLPDQYLRKLVAYALGKQKRGDWRAWRADRKTAALDDLFIEKTIEDLGAILKD